jgi:hypothetical protein
MRLPRFPYTFAQVRKAAVNVAALASEVVAANVVHGRALVIATAVIAVAGAIAHFTVPNEPTVAAMRQLGAVFAPSSAWARATAAPPAGTPARGVTPGVDPHDIPMAPQGVTPPPAGPTS